MARNRQRAKDRKQKLHRENIPGSLDHASGEVEEVEAAIVAGAGGQPELLLTALRTSRPMRSSPMTRSRPRRSPPPPPSPSPRPDASAVASRPLPSRSSPSRSSSRSTRPSRSTTPISTTTTASCDADAATVEHGRLGKGAGDLTVTPDAHKPAGFRLANFIRACWAELQRVDWPDRRQVGQATAVVLGFVVVAGAFLGLADVVAQRIVDFIL